MDIIIGIGGTGAKVVEAVLNLAAMGIGPSSLQVGFVDQDESNGNLNRALTVFDAYRAARADWRDGATHSIAGTEDCAILKTDVQPIDGKKGLWIPESVQGATLAGIFGPMGPDRFLFDALFETGTDEESEEQDLDLKVGYRGRPNIGAAAMTLKSERGGDFWNAITESIKKAGKGKVRIMLTGSIFGGTGAAGFPTIARLIRNRLTEAKIKAESVHIGGILMQPYFWFPDPGDDQDQNVARAHEQAIQSSGALRHYHQLLGDRGQHLFDQLYMVGWDPFFSIDKHAKGLIDQRNPALLPELVAASAAVRFFTHPVDPQAPQQQKVFESARRDRLTVGWADIPAIGDDVDSRKALHRQFAQFLRFAVAFKFWKPQIDDEASRMKVRGDKWYKAQQLNQINWDSGSPSAALDSLEAVLDNVLSWSAAIEAYATRDPDHTFDLWRVRVPLLTEPVDYTTPHKDLKIVTGLSGADYNQLFSSIVHTYADEDAAMPDTATLADYLTNMTVEGAHIDMGRFIAALYHFSDIRPVAVNA